jgi:hypothetical protein
MSVGLHMRLIGHPARAAGLARFLDYVQGHQGVWVTRRLDNCPALGSNASFRRQTRLKEKPWPCMN